MSGLSSVTPLGLAAVGLGAALGAWVRWGLSLAFNALLPWLPLGTVAANLCGGLLIGVAVDVFERFPAIDPHWRLLAVTGFLGGLTTFSTFSAESLALVMRGEWTAALLHSAIHLLGCLAAAGAGFALARGLLG